MKLICCYVDHFRLPGLGAANAGASGTGATSAANPFAANPWAAGGLGNLFGAGFGAGAGAGTTNSASNPAAPNPEEVYASQLTQMADMGFTNREQNVRALQATFGNVHAAVDRILSGLS